MKACWDRAGELARSLIAAFQAERDLVVGDNEPYRGGLPDALEVRQDLIATPEAAREWGIRLARIVPPCVAALNAAAIT